jgi:cyclopropane-fatty-acyl-phospholipid synthase
MKIATAKKTVQKLLQSVGVNINGNESWDIQIHNEAFYPRVLSEGPLGLGDAYMEKWWDCDRLDIFFYRALRAQLDKAINIPFHFYIQMFLAKFINLQTKIRAKDVAYQHYDLGNDLFTAMLDKRMIYSCGYWKDASTLEEAQINKLDLICKKLQLKPGQRLLDIGCGWGGLAKFAAENYGVSVVGVTISKEQCDYAKENCRDLPVDIRLQDYRDINEKFDRVVSVGMFEHVGHKNYATYMKTVRDVLADDGLFLLHTIGVNETGSLANEWIIKHIFPNGMLPSVSQIAETSEKYFIMEDMQNFSAYYDPTLMAWYDNFVKHWETLKQAYDDSFFRMWSYYLLSCAGCFRARGNQLWQFVFSKNGVPGVYLGVR